MDFDSAINAHVQWKTKLSNYLNKPDRSLNPAVVSSDQNCELGKWLHGDGKKHSGLEGFSTLVTEHTRFHKAAGEIIRKADAGEKVSEEMALGGTSDFSKTSAAVIRHLMQLKMLIR